VAAGRVPKVFGSDYPTRDGTCVRDYVHVQPLADAHVVAAKKLHAGEALRPAYNLGSGVGSTVAEVMAAVAHVTGIDFVPEMVDRRPGDPATVVASGQWATEDVGWNMSYPLEEMVSSAWREYARAHAIG